MQQLRCQTTLQEKMNTTSIKSNVHLEKEITRNVEITERVDNDSELSVEFVQLPSTTV